MMELEEFIIQICKDGLASSEIDCKESEDRPKIKGFRDGYNEALSCKTPIQLFDAWKRSHKITQDEFSTSTDIFWYWRSKTSALDWVCNCVSAYQKANRAPSIGTVWPSSGASFKTAQVLGIRYPHRPLNELFFVDKSG